jgi:DNA primase
MIPNEVIDEIIARTDIEQLISGYVSLKRAGSNLVGLCPFHSERSPSFTVYSGNGSFYCFGCGAGGDAIAFIRKAENLDYPDAVEFLAKRAGITIVETDSYGTRPRFDRRRMLDMNREAAKFFHRSLYENTEEAKAALHYLTKQRGLSDATVKHFGLGFAPGGYDARLTAHLLRLGYTEDELTAGFLSGRSERNGKLFDSFRNRVMFPIIDVSGNVIAFGGRVMDDSQPKYKNSSDTPVFKKSRNLFALNFARTSCAERMILCEGYMDVIALHAAGFSQAVATLGTAITPDQARIMSRYTKKVVISYDMDEAGRKAADKAMRLLEEVGLEVVLLSMTDAKDPDEFIRKFGADRFRSVLDGSKSKFDYHMARILGKYRISDPSERIKALAELRDVIAAVPASVEREVYIGVTAKQFDIPAASIRDDVNRLIAKKKREYRTKEHQALRQSMTGYSDRVNPEFSRSPAIARTEETVLGLLLLDRHFRSKLASADAPVTAEDFYTEFSRRVFEYIRDCLADNESESNQLNERFTPDEIGRITSMKLRRMQLTDNGDTVYAESVAMLKKAVSEKRLSESGNAMALLDDILKQKRNDT